MATLKDTIFSAIQDAPALTAREYAELLSITNRMPSVSSTLCTLRDEGYIASETGSDGILRYTAVKAKEISSRKVPEKKGNGQKAVIISNNVVIQYDGRTYELPAAVVAAIKRMK